MKWTLVKSKRLELPSFRRFATHAIGALSLILSACDGKVLLTGRKSTDFARSEIISNGPAVADGASELLVVIQLMNSDGTAVQLFKPTYQITSGTGVLGSECTTSNSNGVSTCVLKSTQAGTKRLSVTNVKIDLHKDLLFTSPAPPGAVTGLVSAANFKQTSVSGHVISGSLGATHSDVVKTSASGWKIYGGPEGNALSR